MTEPPPIPAHAPPAPPARDARAPRTGVPVWLQAFLIVGLGCGTCLALLLLLVLGSAWWVLRPGSQAPTDAIAGPGSVGIVRSEGLAGDEGVRGALEHLSREIADVQAERTQQAAPEWLRRMQGDRRGPPTAFATMLFPRDATLLFDRVAGDDELHVVLAANFRWFVRPARLLFKGLAENGELRSERHAGHLILSDPDGDGACFCFAGSTFLVADDVDLLKLAIDRLGAWRKNGPQSIPSGLLHELPQLQEGWDVTGALQGRAGDVRRALCFLSERGAEERWLQDLVPADLDRTTLAGDWETADRIRARITVETTDDLAVEAWLDRLEQALAELAESARVEGLQLTSELDLYDGRVTLDLSLAGLELLIERIARNF